MVVLEYDSTIEHSSLKFAEYAQHTKDTTYYLFINSTYLVWKSVYTLNILKYDNLYNQYLFMRNANIETHILWKPTITDKAVQKNYSFFISSFDQILITSFCAQDQKLFPWSIAHPPLNYIMVNG